MQQGLVRFSRWLEGRPGDCRGEHERVRDQGDGPHVGLGEIFKGVAPFIVSDFVRLTRLILFPVISLYLVTR